MEPEYLMAYKKRITSRFQLEKKIMETTTGDIITMKLEWHPIAVEDGSGMKLIEL